MCLRAYYVDQLVFCVKLTKCLLDFSAILYYRRAVQLVPDIDIRAEQLRYSSRRGIAYL